MKKIMCLTVQMMALVLGMTFLMTGCGNVEDEKSADSAYPDAVSVLNEAWSSMNAEFPAMGGGSESPVENAPGALALSETDMMTYTLLVPEDLQADLSDAASVIHMMNTNIFTGVVIKVQNTKPEDAAVQIQDKIKNNQFMCGAPEKLTIFTMGSYVAYAYGETANVDAFANALKALDGIEQIVDERLE